MKILLEKNGRKLEVETIKGEFTKEEAVSKFLEMLFAGEADSKFIQERIYHHQTKIKTLIKTIKTEIKAYKE